MVAPGDEISKADSSVFDCAERGVWEEVGCVPDPVATRILSLGIEHANMSASFICLTRVKETFDEVCQSWQKKARDPYEAAALDCVPLTKRTLERLLLHRQYHPSDKACARTDRAAANWHPTARMRLYALMCHFDETEQDGVVS
jgi:hypothetical protein